jgi:ubiquinone/menaquinone biosynthesis C-methylase UbiE
MIKTTGQNKKYWQKRKINWHESYFNLEHPHRIMLMKLLGTLKFNSLMEVGCGAGANLALAVKTFPNLRVGGLEINEDALTEAKKMLPLSIFEQGTVEDMYFSDKTVDLVLTDACLIYVGPTKINKAIEEIKRVARNYVVFVELHEPNFFKRLAIRLVGYNAYDYKKLLKKHGFYDIDICKIPKEVWEGGPWEQFGYYIKAKI